MAVWMDGGWRNRLKNSAVPITKVQHHVLRLLATERSPDSYIAGGVALNREGPRFSGDIDIFQDPEQRLESAAETDAKALTEAAFKLSWKRFRAAKGKRRSKDWTIGCGLNGSTTVPFAFFQHNGTNSSVMYYALLFLPQTKRQLRPTDANPARCR